MMNTSKNIKVAAIHDLSGFGRCSLTVIMPILSAMGIQVCPVPTAVLSAHTGFADMAMTDLTDFIEKCRLHYKSMGVEFDAVYSGFLASAEQIDHCLDFFRGQPNALKVVDPVMGDNGKPYKTYTKDLCKRMSELVGIADIITPNLTEAAILLNLDYADYTQSLSLAVIEDMLKRLCEYSRISVITGIVIGGKTCNIGLDRLDGITRVIEYRHIPAFYSGTGDIFASVLTGSFLLNNDLPLAITKATDFTRKAIEVSEHSGEPIKDGVMFERVLGELTV